MSYAVCGLYAHVIENVIIIIIRKAYVFSLVLAPENTRAVKLLGAVEGTGFLQQQKQQRKHGDSNSKSKHGEMLRACAVDSYLAGTGGLLGVVGVKLGATVTGLFGAAMVLKKKK